MALVQVTDPAFPGAKSVDFIGQMIVYVEPMGRYWGWSGLTDALAYNALDVAQAETSPDRIVGLCVSNNEVLIFGERTIEPWAFAPTDTATFQLRAGSVIESGCGATASIKRIDNSVMYLTNNGQVARLEGYTPRVVSTMAIEADIRERNWAKAFAYTWEDNGHCVYYLTFPDGHTWGYDVRQGKWHRRESYGLNRWRVNCMVKSNGKWMAGDFQNGYVYEVEWRSVYEACEIMPRKFTSGVLHNATNRVTVDAFSLTAATGQPGQTPAALNPIIPANGRLLITGQAPGDGQPMFCKATTIAPLAFEGIPQSSGATLPVATCGYYNGVWLAVADDETRYAGSLDGPWTTGTTPYATYSADLLAGGPDGWLTQNDERVFGEGYAKAGETGAAFTSHAFNRILSDIETGPVYWLSMIRYTGGFWYTDQDGALCKAATLATANWPTLGGYRPDDIVWFRDVVEFKGELYATVQQNIDGDLDQPERYQLRKWNGTDWNEILIDNTGDGAIQPWQIECNDDVLIVYCWGSDWAYTSEDGYSEPHATGLYRLKDDAIHEENLGRQIAVIRDRFFLIDGDSCVSTVDGLTFSEPESLPINAARSIAATGMEDDGTAPPEPPDCEPMEGGRFQLRYASDGAENWSNWRNFDAPVTGKFLQPLQAWRLGQARHRVWQVMDTSDRPQDVLSASIIAQ